MDRVFACVRVRAEGGVEGPCVGGVRALHAPGAVGGQEPCASQELNVKIQYIYSKPILGLEEGEGAPPRLSD